MKNHHKLFIKNLAIVLTTILVFIIIIKTSPVASLEDPGPGENEGSDFSPPSEPDPTPDPSPEPTPEPITENDSDSSSNRSSSESYIKRIAPRNVVDSEPISTEETAPLEQVVNLIPISDNSSKPEEELQEIDVGTSETMIEPEENVSGATTNSGSSSDYYVPKIIPIINQPIPEKIATTLTKVDNTIKQASKETAKVVSSPAGEVITTTVASAGIISGASLSGSAILSSIDTIAVSDFSIGIIRFWGLLMTALGFKKRNKPWGSVYDSVTKQPIDPVYVKLEDENGKEITSAITDIDGRYGFLAPRGIYRLVAHKTNYEFPSKKAFGKTVDEIYPDLYFGETVEITADGGVISKNIPMDPIKFDWNEFEKNEKHLMKFYSKRSLIFARIANILFLTGLVLTLILAITVPKGYNIFFLIVYFVLYLARNTVIKPKSYGTVVEKETGNPLSFAIVHLKNAEQTINRVVNKIGKFYCLVPNGTYEIRIDKKNPDESYTEVFKEENFEIKKGLLNKKFEV
jgi:hypothetical protein